MKLMHSSMVTKSVSSDSIRDLASDTDGAVELFPVEKSMKPSNGSGEGTSSTKPIEKTATAGSSAPDASPWVDAILEPAPPTMRDRLGLPVLKRRIELPKVAPTPAFIR